MAIKEADLTQQILQELFEYDEGFLRHLQGESKGEIACKPQKSSGYRRVQVLGKGFRAHRIIYLLINGWVPEQLDHRDRVRDNNLIDNLRVATNSENQANRVNLESSGSRHKGVSRLGSGSDHWQSSICANGTSERLGTFLTEDCAGAAYNTAAKRLHGEFAVLNDVASNHVPIRLSHKAQKPIKNGTWSASGYRGVYASKEKWVAAIRHNGKSKHVATCSSPELAAAAYDQESIKLFGNRAQTNVKAGLLDPSIVYTPKPKVPQRRYPQLAKTNTSGYKGVWRHKKKWAASIQLGKKKVFLGSHDSAAQAARAYDAAAISSRGPGASTNVSLGLLPDLLKLEK